MKFSHTLLGALGGVVLACGAALARTPRPRRVGARPSRGQDHRRLGGALLPPVTSPSPCDMFQELDDQRTRQRVLSFSIAYVPSLNKHGIQITVPLEVSIQKGLTIVTDSYTSPVMKFRYCDRAGCFVQMPFDNAAVESISRSGPDAKVRIFADNGKAYDLRFSLKGFTAPTIRWSSRTRPRPRRRPPLLLPPRRRRSSSSCGDIHEKAGERSPAFFVFPFSPPVYGGGGPRSGGGGASFADCRQSATVGGTQLIPPLRFAALSTSPVNGGGKFTPV